MKKYLLCVLFLCLGCKTEKIAVEPTGLVTSKAMVVSAREEASQIGVQIMQQGGTAFDAMIATELALAVV